MGYRATVHDTVRGTATSQEFDEFGPARDWLWSELHRTVHWGDRMSATIVLPETGELIIQIIASERVGMYDRGTEQFKRPTSAKETR